MGQDLNETLPKPQIEIALIAALCARWGGDRQYTTARGSIQILRHGKLPTPFVLPGRAEILVASNEALCHPRYR